MLLEDATSLICVVIAFTGEACVLLEDATSLICMVIAFTD